MNISEAFDAIKQAGTNGCNYDVSNEDILNQIAEWHETLEIEILEVTPDAVTIHFKSLPVDTRKFAQALYEFCPDIVDQHFGCFDELIEAMEESGEAMPKELQNLIEGVDFDSDNYGVELLEKALKTDGRVQLWWD